MPEIDLDQYQEGRRSFDEGGSMLAIVQRAMSIEPRDHKGEGQALSFGLGFLDAALDRLRGITP